MEVGREGRKDESGREYRGEKKGDGGRRGGEGRGER